MLRGRPRRGALGLRGRIAGAVLVTTVATLAIAALALLPRLEGSLRTAARTTLLREVQGATAAFRRLNLKYVLDAESLAKGANGKYLDPEHEEGLRERRALTQQQDSLGSRISASVYLVGDFNVHGVGKVLAPPSDADALTGRFDDVAQAFRTGKKVPSFASIDGTDYARVAIPITIRNGTVEYVLAVRKSIDEIPGAVRRDPDRVPVRGCRRAGPDPDPRHPALGHRGAAPPGPARGGSAPGARGARGGAAARPCPR